jgi:outer membrane protein assembly factor BamB
MIEKYRWYNTLKGKRDIGNHSALVTRHGVLSIFFYGFSNSRTNLRMHNVENGDVLWEQDIEGTVTVVEEMENGSLLVPLMQGNAIVLSSSGRIISEYRVAKSNIWSIIPCSSTDGLVNEIHGSGRGIERINMHSGTLQWRLDVNASCKAPALLFPNYYFVSSVCSDHSDFDSPYLNKVHNVDIKTGHLLWQETISCYPLSLLIHDGLLLVGSRGKVVVMDRFTGLVKQSLVITNDTNGIYSMAANKHALYTCSDNGVICKFGFNDQYQMEKSVNVAEGGKRIELHGELLYTQNNAGDVLELDANTLDVLRTFKVKKIKTEAVSFTVTCEWLFASVKNSIFTFALN